MHFGIDFGTTNSAAVELDGQGAHYYGDEHGKPMPSVVAISCATDEVVVGREAWNRRLEFLEVGGYVVIPSVKRVLGTDMSWAGSARVWTPRDIAASVLRRLSSRASELGVSIRRATFSLPVGLSARARHTLREAATDAGIEVGGFVTESTAAFMRYFPRLKHHRHVAVFDWGGGTLDISVLRLEAGTVTELATRGLEQAGDRIDSAVARHIHSKVMDERRSPLAFEEMPSRDRDALVAHSERAKCDLATRASVNVALERYGAAPVFIPLSRDEAAPVLRPFIDAALNVLGEAIAAAGLSVDLLGQILFVGGSSQLWLLRESLAQDERFAGRYMPAQNAEWDVAHGAALIAQAPGCDVVTETVAILLSDGRYYDLVSAGSQVPVERRSVALALVEDTREANLVVDRLGEDGRYREPAFCLSVPTQGFLDDEVQVDYEVTRDLVLRLEASSRSRGPTSRQLAEFTKLQIGYSLPSEP